VRISKFLWVLCAAICVCARIRSSKPSTNHKQKAQHIGQRESG
jgi:hypothetical protein